METAKQKGLRIISMTGAGGGKLVELSDVSLDVPSNVTARVQEMHILMIHIMCEIMEEKM